MGRKAPWTDEEIAGMRAWQEDGTVHPMTCSRHSGVKLEVGRDALTCPTAGCDYRQEWVPTALTGGYALDYLERRRESIASLTDQQPPLRQLRGHPSGVLPVQPQPEGGHDADC